MTDRIGRRRFVAAAVGAAAAAFATSARPGRRARDDLAARLELSEVPRPALRRRRARSGSQVTDITGGRFKLDVSPPGEAVTPAAGVLDAVQAGTIEACQTQLDYFTGKDPAFALPTAFPFGMNAREQIAYALSGRRDRRDQCPACRPWPRRLSGRQHRRPDGRVLQARDQVRGRISPASRSAPGAYPAACCRSSAPCPHRRRAARSSSALESGALDGVTWVGPYDDAKIAEGNRLQKAAPYYYYPGWWRGGSMVHVVFNKTKFDALPAPFQGGAASTRGARDRRRPSWLPTMPAIPRR